MNKLIEKYLTGQATEQELVELEAWAKRSSQNRRMLARYTHAYALSGSSPNKSDPTDLCRIVSAIKKRNHSKRVIRYFSAVGYAASILIVAGLFYFTKTNSVHREVAYILSQADTYLEYSTPFGVKSKITLPDNSVVWLNSGSKISFPSKFAGEHREITFSGEGYFDIIKDTLRPMQISTPNDINIKVLGTKFNLTTYKEDKTFSLMLVSGKVLVTKGGSTIAEMKPADNFTLEHETRKRAINQPKDTMRITGWREGWLIFDDTPLLEVFTKMKRWYGVSVKVEDQNLYHKTFSAKFKEESASQVFDFMHKISLIDYTLADSIAYISPYKPRFAR